MTTEVTVSDLDNLKSAIEQVRSDKHGVDRRAWVVIGHVDNNPSLIDVVCEGGSLNEMHPVLSDTQVMYGLIRLTTTFDMSTTVKFVYVRWIGENVPAVKKGRYGVVHGSVEQYFQPYHLQVEVSSVEDLKEEVLVQKLDESSGTRNKVIEGSVQGMQERGFTQHAVKKQEKGVLKSVAPAGATVEVSPELQAALGDVRHDESATSWVLGTYEDGNVKKPLSLVASGTGDIEELKTYLQPDQVMYGLYRTGDEIDEIKTVKFVYLYWIGENVKPLMKGKVSASAGFIERVFSPAHVTFNFTSLSDITSAVIRDKVTASSGSKSHVK